MKQGSHVFSGSPEGRNGCAVQHFMSHLEMSGVQILASISSKLRATLLILILVTYKVSLCRESVMNLHAFSTVVILTTYIN